MTALLELQGVTKRFPGVLALDAMDLEVLPGEVHVLLGANGAGKSTLIKIVGGVYRPDAGEIRLNGEPLRLRSPRDARDRGINVIYQEFTLVPQMTVSDNLFLGREPARGVLGLLDRSAARERALAVLKRLGADLDPAVRVDRLGVGQQQLVEIAKALAFDCRILIMDEPTAALSPGEIEKLFGIVEDLKQAGVGVIYVSHRLEEVRRIGDRVTVLRDGRRVKTLPAAEAVPARVIPLMVGRKVTNRFPWRKRPVGEPVLEVRGLGAAGYFQGIDFTLHRGEVLGLTGLVGAGRSSLLLTLFGALRATSGEVALHGRPFRPASPLAAIEAGLALIPENRKEEGAVQILSVVENLTLAALGRFRRGFWLDVGAERETAEGYRSRLAIRTASLATRLEHLSGGNQQKVILAKWLASDSQVFLFDEPTRGLDIQAKEEIYSLIFDLAGEGHAVLLNTSELDEAMGLCDRLLVMHRGRLVATFGREKFEEETILSYCLTGGAVR